MEGVVLRGTAHALQTEQYTFAGKTGTSLVADKGITYADKMYQSSFAGYFPADNPQYTIVVVIRNRAHAPRFYGGVVAAPVFREVADRLYANHLYAPLQAQLLPKDSSHYQIIAHKQTLQRVATVLGWKLTDSTSNAILVACQLDAQNGKVLRGQPHQQQSMPMLQGIGLKDALALCEERGLQVSITGKGRVAQQSITAGTAVQRGQIIHLQLN
jgi:cell division protein FtsI (penicillin-binding protein 3)